jgi:signal transduction histidine kinase
MLKRQLLITTILIVCAALALAFLSILNVRSQRESMDRERARRAQKLAEAISEEFRRWFGEFEKQVSKAALEVPKHWTDSIALPALLSRQHIDGVFVFGKDGSRKFPLKQWRETDERQTPSQEVSKEYEKAEAIELSGQLTEALANYENLLQLPEFRQHPALLWNALARVHHKNGNLNTALRLYRRLLQEYPAELALNGFPLAAVSMLQISDILIQQNEINQEIITEIDFLDGLLTDRIPATPEETAFVLSELESMTQKVSRAGASEDRLEQLRKIWALVGNLVAAKKAAESLREIPPISEPQENECQYYRLDSQRLLAVSKANTEGDRMGIALRLGSLQTAWSSSIQRLLQHASDFDFEIRDGAKNLLLQAANGPLPSPAFRMELAPQYVPGWELSIGVSDSPEMLAAARLRTQTDIAVIALLLLTIGASLVFMNAMVRRSDELGALKADFVSAVSHEMRTPLATIRMIAEMFQLKRVNDPQTEREYLETITSETDRLTRLIDKVLDFSRIDSGRKTYSFAPCDLSEIVTSTIRNFEAGLPKECQIQLAIEPALPRILAEEDALVQALLNLLENALKYSQALARIEVSLTRAGSELRLQVSDQGIGIDPRNHEMIFERFYRCEDELTRRTTGTGLGLSIVKNIVEAHRGRIEVDSALGRGSRFTLILPMNLQE